MPQSPAGPLQGVKVVDFCSFIAGSYGAMLLGDLGAEIIKVESPAGDLARVWGPFFAGEGRWFQAWNRNKRSIALDLRSDAGWEIVYDLVRRADVVIENFRVGITDKLRIDYGRLREINPRLIYCSSTAFGPKGPYRDRPAYDPVLQAMGGAAHANIRYSGKVAICSVAVSDYQAAMLAVSGILAALYYRDKTGVGQKIDTSLLQGIMSVQAHYYCQALDCPTEGPLGIAPYQLFDTSDAQIFIGPATEKFWRLLCEALGAPDLADDPRFANNSLRVEHIEELAATLAPYFSKRTTAEWEAILIKIGVPCGAVKTYEEFFDDPQVAAMDMSTVVEHATIGRVRMAGVAIHFEKTPGKIQRAAPLLGEHTAEILQEIGYDAEKIQKLREAGIVMSRNGERTTADAQSH